jgi:fission process protein 1
MENIKNEKVSVPIEDGTKDELAPDPFIENPMLRVLGLSARAGRLFGVAFAKGGRYLAYTSDVGEAFRPVAHINVVRAGYAVSWIYVLGDIGYSMKRARDAKQDVVRTGAHTALFQVFGSMLIPAVIIHSVVHNAEKAFHRFGRQSKWGPTMLGFACIPFLPYIADEPTEYVVNELFSRFWPSTDPSIQIHVKPHEEKKSN